MRRFLIVLFVMSLGLMQSSAIGQESSDSKKVTNDTEKKMAASTTQRQVAAKKADIVEGHDGRYYANGHLLRFYPTIRDKEISPAKVKKIELYFSSDKGNTWKRYGEVPDVNTIFKFEAKQDGEYHFASVATDELGQKGKIPAAAVDAHLSVIIDTTDPVIVTNKNELKLKCNPKDIRKITWKNKDTNPYYVKVEEYRPLSKGWSEKASIKDQAFYTFKVPNVPYTNYKVRVTAVDMAGNESTPEIITFNLGALINTPVSSLGVPSSIRNNVISFVLSHEGMLEGKFASYDVYYTDDDGSSWALAGSTRKKTMAWKVPKDGKYGFYSVVVDKDGTGEALPQPTDRPKVVCLVDTKKPVLVIDSPKGGERFTTDRPLVIAWHGVETNAKSKPVKIEISRDNGANFEFVAMGKLNGTHHLRLDGYAGHHFKIRLSIEDEAQNFYETTSKRFAIGTLTEEEQAQVKAHFEKANAYRVFGRWKEALEQYREVLKYDVQHDKALNDMGVVYMKLKQYDMAIKVFQKATRVKIKNTDYQFNLGYSFYVNDMPLLAQATFEKLLTIKKDHVRSHWYLAEIYLLNKDVKKTREHLEKILEIDSSDNQLKPLAKKRLVKLEK